MLFGALASATVVPAVMVLGSDSHDPSMHVCAPIAKAPSQSQMQQHVDTRTADLSDPGSGSACMLHVRHAARCSATAMIRRRACVSLSGNRSYTFCRQTASRREPQEPHSLARLALMKARVTCSTRQTQRGWLVACERQQYLTDTVSDTVTVWRGRSRRLLWHTRECISLVRSANPCHVVTVSRRGDDSHAS
jgi:hypothetical protein